jgi:hypothetical protein
MIVSEELDKKLRNEVENILRYRLAKYVGQKVTPELRKQIVADLLDLAHDEKKR